MPSNLVSPVPALCVKLAAVSAFEKVTSLAETSVTAPNAPPVPAPTALAKETAPAPAVIVRLRAEDPEVEFNVELKVTALSVVVSDVFAVSLTAPV